MGLWGLLAGAVNGEWRGRAGLAGYLARLRAAMFASRVAVRLAMASGVRAARAAASLNDRLLASAD